MNSTSHSLLTAGSALDSAPSTAARLAVRLVTTSEAFYALEPHWDSLLERSAVRTPFMTWDWVSLWWETHGHGCKLRVAVIDDPRTGEPLAIAPMIIGRPRDGSRRALRHLTFLGGIGEDASQGMDFLVPRGQEAALTPLLCQVFRKSVMRFDVIDLPTMHEESPNIAHCRTALSTFSRAGDRCAPQKSFLMSLPPTWEEQMNLWRSKDRVAFRSKWRKLMDEHQGRALLGGTDLPADKAFDELWRLHGYRFEGEHSMFLNEGMSRLHRALVQRWTPRGRILLPLIEADGKIVAARYGFAFEGKYWSYQTGYDPEYAKLSVGKLSLGWAAQCAIQHGLTEIDHMPGDARYKEEWSTHTRTVRHLEAFNHLSLTAAVFRLIRAARRQRAAHSPPNTTEAPAA